MKLEEFICYADGSCINNGSANSRGGWGYVILESCHKKIYSEGSGEDSPTTNNRMEMKAVIEAIKSFPQKVKLNIYTDSQYVIHGFEKKWINKWIDNDFKNSAGTEIKNRDLWEELYALVIANEITWTWVKGHSGVVFNEYVDKLAYKQSSKNNSTTKKKTSRKQVQKAKRKLQILSRKEENI